MVAPRPLMINASETVTSAMMARIDSARSVADSQIDVTARRGASPQEVPLSV